MCDRRLPVPRLEQLFEPSARAAIRSHRHLSVSIKADIAAYTNTQGIPAPWAGERATSWLRAHVAFESEDDTEKQRTGRLRLHACGSASRSAQPVAVPENRDTWSGV